MTEQSAHKPTKNPIKIISRRVHKMHCYQHGFTTNNVKKWNKHIEKEFHIHEGYNIEIGNFRINARIRFAGSKMIILEQRPIP